MAVSIVSRRISGGGSITSVSTDALRLGAAGWRRFLTSFREERDTFGPIQVPSDK